MEYGEIKILKQSEKSTVQLVKEQDGERLFVRKILQGRHQVYQTLSELSHPYLPIVYEVVSAEDKTTVIEEYIEEKTACGGELSEKQCVAIIRELCDVLSFLHKKGIIHRDIKPSNIILAKDGHIRLIDFDAARMPKEDLEQDTTLLGTRGYAPPEQYGFAQTDERADIYALGVTVKQLLGDKAEKKRYRRIISKCTNLDPDKRYQSVRLIKKDFSRTFDWRACIICTILLTAMVICAWKVAADSIGTQEVADGSTELIVLPVPTDLHWDGETGTALWEHVPESGVGIDERYDWRLYRCDMSVPPDMERDEWGREGTMRGSMAVGDTIFDLSFSEEFWENGYYYVAVRASGDGVTYADSPYVLSDGFCYTGESAERLPMPEGLHWIAKETDEDRFYFTAISNWEDYEDTDHFNAYVYKENGEYVMNNIASKQALMSREWPGVRIRPEFVSEPGETYRFAIQVISSRPNEYKSTPAVEPCPEEAYLSPQLNVPHVQK